MKPRFKFHYALLDGWRLEVLNQEAHELAMKMQVEKIKSMYPICNLIGDDNQYFYYYDVPIQIGLLNPGLITLADSNIYEEKN